MLRELAAVPVGGLGLAARLKALALVPAASLGAAALRELAATPVGYLATLLSQFAAIPAGAVAAAVVLKSAMAGAVGIRCASAEMLEEGCGPACIDKHVEW